MGSASVMGGDMEIITAARLDRARRAERTIEAAFGTQRVGMLEPNDAVLQEMLAQVGQLVTSLELGAEQYARRGGPLIDDVAV